jgi:hypothetical protein
MATTAVTPTVGVAGVEMIEDAKGEGEFWGGRMIALVVLMELVEIVELIELVELV